MSKGMKIKQITTTCARKWGLPEYGNFELFVSMQAETGSNPREEAKALLKCCENLIETEGAEKLKEYYRSTKIMSTKLKKEFESSQGTKQNGGNNEPRA